MEGGGRTWKEEEQHGRRKNIEGGKEREGRFNKEEEDGSRKKIRMEEG